MIRNATILSSFRCMLLLFVAVLLSGTQVYAQGGPPAFSKLFQPDIIGPGSTTRLVFTIDNSGGGPTTGLAFTDNLPAGMTIATPASASTTCSGGTLSAPAGGTTFSYSGGGVGPGATCTIGVNVIAAVVDNADTGYTNTSGDLTSSAGNSGPATDDLTVDVDLPGFSKSFSESSIPFGSRATLTFTIDNTLRGGVASSLAFTDVLPAGLEFASPINTSNTCNGNFTVDTNTNTINLILGFVLPGETCTITVDVVGVNVGPQDNVSSNLSSSEGNAGFATDRLTVTTTTVALIKEFVDDPVSPGGIASLQFTIQNRDRGTTATNIAFADTLENTLTGLAPSGPLPTDPCGTGSLLVFNPVNGTLDLTNGTVESGASCTFTVPLEVPSGAALGSYPNTTNTLTSSLGDGNMASDALFVAAVPLFTKTFLSDTAVPGGTIMVEFEITNTSTTSSATDIAFSDNLSAFISGATANGVSPPVSNVCGSGSILFAQDVNGDLVLQLNGGNLAPGASCTIPVELNIPEGTPINTYTNTTSGITATVDGVTAEGPAASDDIDLVSAPSLSKEFLDDPVTPGSTVTLEFTLTLNENASTDATGITFTDDLDAALSGLVATGLPMNNVCGTGSILSGTSTLTLTNGTLSPSSSCTFSVTLDVPTDAAIGSHTNTTSDVAATVSGESVIAPGASDDLEVQALTVTKSFTDDPVYPGGTVTLEFSLSLDTNAPTAASDISFIDNLDAALTGLVSTSGTQNDICGTGSSLSGTSPLIFTGGTLTPDESCTFSVTLQVPGGAAPDDYLNSTSPITHTVGGNSYNAPPAIDILTVADPTALIQLSKEFTNDPVDAGGTVTLEFTLDFSGPEAATGIAFNDDLDATLSGLTSTSGTLNDVCGAGSQISGTSVLTFTGGTLPAGTSSCTFSVTLQVPGGATPASYPNTTSSITASSDGIGITGDPATDNLVISDVPDVSATKVDAAFDVGGDGTLNPGDTIEYTIEIANNGGRPASSVVFNDTPDANSTLVVGSVTTTQGTVTSGNTAGDTTVGVDVGTLAGGGTTTTVTFQVVITSPFPAGPDVVCNQGSVSGGNFTALVTGDPDETGADDPEDETCSPFVADPDVAATKTDAVLIDNDTDTQADPGDTIRYTIVVANNGNQEAVDVMFADTPDANTALVVGSVTTTQGAVTTGNTGGDTTVGVDVGTVGDTPVTITFDVVVNNPFAVGVDDVSNQGTVSGSNFADVPTDDPDDATSDSDPTVTPIDAESDLSITKDDSDVTVEPGDTISYTIDYANNGDQNATGVTITDTVPIGTTFDLGASTTGWSCADDDPAGTDCTFDVGALAGGGAGSSITFAVTVDNPVGAGIDEIENTASIDDDGANGADPTPDDNTDTDTAPVDAEPDLAITKTDGDVTVEPGDTISYTLDYANNGDQDAAGVTITDTVPVGTTFDATGSTAGWSCADSDPAGTICTFDVGALAGGGTTGSVDFVVTADNPIGAGIEEIENTASITDDEANGTDPNPDDNTDTDTTPVDAEPDLAITKDDGDLTAQPGDTIPYTLDYANNGDQNATGVTITDTVPVGTTFDATGSTAGWSCADNDPAGTICTFDVGALAGGGAGSSITFAVAVDNPIGAGIEEIENTASITDDEANGTDPNPDDNTDTDTTPIEAAPEVSATKRDELLVDQDGDGLVDPGDTIGYTIIVSNDGDQNVADVVVTDTVDPLLDLDCGSLTPGQGTIISCTPGLGGSFTVDLTEIDGEPRLLAPKATADITFSATVAVPFPGTADEVTNQAVVSYTGETGTEEIVSDDPDTTRPRDPTVTPIDLSADLELTKTASTTTPNFGTEVVFTITVTNQGPVDVVTGVDVRDVLPKGLEFVSAEGDGEYNPETGIWDLDGVAMGEPETIEITVLVDVVTPITNVAEVLRAGLPDSDSTPGDGQGDDYDSVTLTPIAADLELSKRLASRVESADGLSVTGTFTLTLTNKGPSAATGVEVMEFFAGEMTFVSASPAGAFNPATDVWTVGTLAAGTSTTLSITVTAPTGVQVFNLAEVSAVNETDPDSTPLDGTGDDFAGVALNRGNVPVPPLQADVSITKTISQAQPVLGEQITYTITVSNDGPFTTAGVEVTDLLPEGLAFVSASGSSDGAGCDPCTYDEATGIWTVGKLVDGETATLVIVVEVTAEGEITNTAKLTSNYLPDPDSDLSNDSLDEDDIATAIATVAGGKATSVVRNGGEGIPETYEMGQNYPNPFNPQTTIPFGVPQAGRVVVEVYNLLGQRVAVLMDQELSAGRHEVVWQALDQPTGMYLVRMVAGETTLTKRITLIK